MYRFVVILVVAWGCAHVSGERLKFTLSGSNLADRDFIGITDPYVRVSYAPLVGGMEIPLGRTNTVMNTMNPQWRTVFSVNHRQGAKQRLHFRVYDRDAGLDDHLGEGYLDLDSYRRSGQNAVVVLPKGQLMVKRI